VAGLVARREMLSGEARRARGERDEARRKQALLTEKLADMEGRMLALEKCHVRFRSSPSYWTSSQTPSQAPPLCFFSWPLPAPPLLSLGTAPLTAPCVCAAFWLLHGQQFH